MRSLIPLLLASNLSAASVLDVSVFDAVSLARNCNPRLTLTQSLVVADAVFSAAKKHSVKTSTILGIITVESTFDPSAVSSYGAVGLMQVVPRMHRDKLDAVKKQATNVKDNVDVGTQILQEYVSKYGNDRGLVKYSGKATRYGEKVLRASSMKRNQQCPK